MKRYKQYMDDIKAPDTLRQRLRGLETPAKRPVPWKKCGTAAALVLAAGVGVWGLSGGFPFAANRGLPRMETAAVSDIIGQPDIAIEDPSEIAEPGEKTLGGYDVTIGSGAEAVVAHYVLPYIEYGEVDGAAMSLDWDIPPGAVRRDLTRDEIVMLMGGEDAVNTHLDWGGYDLTGWGAWYEDGSFWGAYIDGILFYAGGLANQFEFAVTADQLPPTCLGYPNSVTQEIRGITVTADKSDWEEHIFSWPTYVHQRRLSFMKDGYGCRFEMSCGGSGEAAEELASRLVARIADRGINLSLLGGTNDDSSRGSGWCGVPGVKVPEFVPDYDPAYEDGVAMTQPHDPEESGEICGLPLAGDPVWKDTGSIVPAQYQSAPPTLRVLSSEGLADGRSGNYEWTYTEIGSDVSASVVACGVHPLDFQDAPGLTTEDGTVTLNFFDLPDQVSAVCWPDSEWGNTSAASQPARVSRNGQTCALTLKDGGWIYEISAGWDGQGTAGYVFYIVKN